MFVDLMENSKENLHLDFTVCNTKMYKFSENENIIKWTNFQKSQENFYYSSGIQKLNCIKIQYLKINDTRDDDLIFEFNVTHILRNEICTWIEYFRIEQ